jgi:hypothetical protein
MSFFNRPEVLQPGLPLGQTRLSCFFYMPELSLCRCCLFHLNRSPRFLIGKKGNSDESEKAYGTENMAGLLICTGATAFGR